MTKWTHKSEQNQERSCRKIVLLRSKEIKKQNPRLEKPHFPKQNLLAPPLLPKFKAKYKKNRNPIPRIPI